MKLLSLAVFSVLCALNQAITFSTIATVSLTLLSLNKPASCFFGMFRRRKSPPVQETVAPTNLPPFTFPNQAMTGQFFNPFASFGGGGAFYPGFSNPGFNNPGFGMSAPSNRFPPQFNPAQSMNRPQMQPPVPVQQMLAPLAGQTFSEDRLSNIIPAEIASKPRDPNIPVMDTEEAESFFTLLSETDENQCISRLVCEIGVDPERGGEFGQTIAEIIESLKDFPDGSKTYHYNEAYSIGLVEGLSNCLSHFRHCDEESFQLVKSVEVENGAQS